MRHKNQNPFVHMFCENGYIPKRMLKSSENVFVLSEQLKFNTVCASHSKKPRSDLKIVNGKVSSVVVPTKDYLANMKL